MLLTWRREPPAPTGRAYPEPMSPTRPHPSEIEWAEAEIGESVREAEVVYTLADRRTTRLVVQSGRTYFLKVAPGLLPERERLGWLRGRLPVPEVRAFGQGKPVDRLLTVGLPGEDLTTERHRADPERLVELLAAALRRIHALDPLECPFRAGDEDGGVVVHGDACLPNFLVHEGRLSGYVDLGSCRIAPPAVDLEAAVWSLRHNLGDGWGEVLLERYGWGSTAPATVESLAAAYERRR